MGDVNIHFSLGNTQFHVLSLTSGPMPYMPMHVHSSDSYELHAITQGRGLVHIDSETYQLAAGDFYLTGPGVSHEQIPDSTDTMHEIGDRTFGLEIFLTKPGMHWTGFLKKNSKNQPAANCFFLILPQNF